MCVSIQHSTTFLTLLLFCTAGRENRNKDSTKTVSMETTDSPPRWENGEWEPVDKVSQPPYDDGKYTRTSKCSYGIIYRHYAHFRKSVLVLYCKSVLQICIAGICSINIFHNAQCHLNNNVTHHAKRVPWVKIFDIGCLPDFARVGLQSWEQYGVKILEIF